MIKTLSLTTAALLTVASSASAGVVDYEIVFQGSATDGISQVAFDIYHLEITNNSGDALLTFNNIGINGAFVQATASTKTSTTLELAPGFFQGETFWSGAGVAPSLFGNSTDDAGSLSAESVASLGTPWVASGATGTIAVFSVAAGGDAPVFQGGFAVVDGQNVAITPEPGSLALLGLGGLALIRRRK
jgi:hypothetical protein